MSADGFLTWDGGILPELAFITPDCTGTSYLTAPIDRGGSTLLNTQPVFAAITGDGRLSMIGLTVDSTIDRAQVNSVLPIDTTTGAPDDCQSPPPARDSDGYILVGFQILGPVPVTLTPPVRIDFVTPE